MRIGTLIRISAAVSAFALPGAAMAQAPMAEVIGQPIVVTTNGVTNTLYFDAGGNVRIVTPNSSTVPATWAMQQGNLCLTKGAATECWPYNSPFQPQQARTMASSCGVTSTWLPQGTNNPSQSLKGERGK